MEISTINEGSAASFRQTINENFTQLEILTGTTAPTTATVGAIGQLYLFSNTTTGENALYQCTAINGETYTWVDIILTQGYKKITVSDTAPENASSNDFWFEIIN